MHAGVIFSAIRAGVFTFPDCWRLSPRSRRKVASLPIQPFSSVVIGASPSSPEKYQRRVASVRTSVQPHARQLVRCTPQRY